ncbi:MAG TPA: 50S ribosomal protein L20 [Steroidobacteraceae bacterium]|nr:50S ribosomal protein L20 [Steroidobacteraceae bacterium]
MARVKRGVTAGRRHKKVLGKAKGYYNARRKVYRAAKQAVIKAGQYAYRHRRAKKRDFRALWIMRINAAARVHGLSYSRLIAGLKLAGLSIDRKLLADLAVNDAVAFGVIAQKAQASLPAQAVPRAQAGASGASGATGATGSSGAA